MHAAVLLLALALAGQPDERKAAEGVALDLAFAGAVEDFARPTIPAPYAAMFARLGADRYADREAASGEALEALNAHRADIRWLLAGRHDRDPEVRVRLVAIGRRLFRCPNCGGKGVSKNWSEWPCYDCGGAGHVFPFGPFD